MRILSPLFSPTACALVAIILSYWQIGCSRTAQSYLERGNRYYSSGQYDDAVLNYRNSLRLDQKLAEGHFRLAIALIAKGEPVEAYAELRKAKAAAPEREDIQLKLADLALQLYSTSPQKPKVLYDEVANAAEDLLNKDASSFDGLRLRADVLALDGRLDEALTTFRKANGIKPLDPRLVLAMVQVQLRLNQVEGAETLARQLFRVHKDSGEVYDVLLNYYVQAKRMADAESLLKTKIANMPKDSTPILQLAGLYHQQHREQEMAEALKLLASDPKSFPKGHLSLGDFYASIGKYEDAIREYTSGLTSNSQDKINYQKRIVRVLVAQGKREQAIEQLSQVLKEHPDDMDSRLARAVIIVESNDEKKLDSAISELKSLIEKTPNDEIAHYNLGLAYRLKGNSNTARAEFTESAKLRPTYIPPRKMLAELDQREHNYTETVRLADEILAISPDDPEARLLHAGALLGSKAYSQARAELTALLKQYPDSVNINLHMAVLDTQEQKYRDAEARYRRFYKPGDKDLRPLEGLVQLYAAENQPDKALALVEQEVKQAPDSRPAHLLLASLATRMAKLDLAIKQYQWLQANDPKSVAAYQSLGDAYQLSGDITSALASYQRARDLTPSDPKIIGMIAYLQDASGKDVDAISNLKKQLELAPQDPVAMNNLAFILADSGTDLDRAMTLAQEAQRKAPNNPGVADTVGWVYVKKGLNDSAIQIFTTLLRKYPDDPSFRYHLGVALLQKGETVKAKSEFVISLANNPSKEIAAKIKQILSKLG